MDGQIAWPARRWRRGADLPPTLHRCVEHDAVSHIGDAHVGDGLVPDGLRERGEQHGREDVDGPRDLSEGEHLKAIFGLLRTRDDGEDAFRVTLRLPVQNTGHQSMPIIVHHRDVVG